MNYIEATRTAIWSLKANLGRSLLTMLGIIIGVAAIVLVMALGQGARQLIISQIESFGANTLILRPGREPEQPTDVAESILTDSLTAPDVAALRRPSNVPDVRAVDPAVLVPGEAGHQDNLYRPVILGWTAEAIASLFQITPEEGALFTDEDIDQHAAVALIGDKVRRELFVDSPALGQTITIRGHKLRVVGIFAPRGQVLAFNVDDLVLVPYTTAQRELLGINYFHEIFIQAEPDADIATVADDVRTTLREQHNIADPAKDDFFVVTQQDIVNRLTTVTLVLTLFLVAMASISLVVGGIGIMNIMLVAVTERTHEIGLRKAVGATNADILRQFLAEAILLTVSGGVLGTILSLTLSVLVTLIARRQFNLAWPLTIPTLAIVLGIGVAAAVGLFFGLYPARQAAHKDPIEALRYE